MNSNLPLNNIDNQFEKNKCFNESPKKVFGTHEWASHSANFINGCKHDCKYCYSKEMAIRFRRKTPTNWKDEEVRRGNLSKKFKKIKGTIMFPSSHDIHPDHLKESLIFLENILVAENKVLIVSKPHLECVQSICNKFTEFKNNIIFRFTIGSSNSETLKFWEPCASDFSERLASLRWAYNKGFQTSISCEPMLDNNVDDVIEKVSPFVTDAIWIGKANYLLKRLTVNNENGSETIKMANELIEWQSDKNIMDLYRKFKNNRKIKWKESIKRVVGIEIPIEKGLDI